MSRGQITHRQTALWLFTAMTAPVLQISGFSNWLSVLIPAAPVMLICAALWQFRAEKPSKIHCAIQLLWLTVLLGVFSSWSTQIWPTGQGFPVVPVILLALAVMGAQKGTTAAAQVNTILFFFVIAILGIIGVAGTEEWKIEYAQPTMEYPLPQVILITLLPATVCCLPKTEQKHPMGMFAAVFAFLIVAHLWIAGVLSPAIAKEQPWPFYEAVKSISLFANAKRFEALVSVVASFGYYSLFSMMLCAIGQLTNKIKEGADKQSVITAAAIAGVLMLIKLETAMIYICFGTFVILLLAPFIQRIFAAKKNRKKDEKST